MTAADPDRRRRRKGDAADRRATRHDLERPRRAGGAGRKEPDSRRLVRQGRARSAGDRAVRRRSSGRNSTRLRRLSGGRDHASHRRVDRGRTTISLRCRSSSPGAIATAAERLRAREADMEDLKHCGDRNRARYAVPLQGPKTMGLLNRLNVDEDQTTVG